MNKKEKFTAFPPLPFAMHVPCTNYNYANFKKGTSNFNTGKV